jgi:acetyl-CoA C-acetyltransferase
MTLQTASGERVPVIVGVGQINDRPPDPYLGLDSAALMEKSLILAEADSRCRFLDKIDWLGVENQISQPCVDIHEQIAQRLPRRPATVYLTEEPSGDGPVRLLNEAADRIASGEVEVAAIVGAEAMRTAMRLAREAGAQGAENPLLAESQSRATSLADRYGLLTPLDVYPLYENATRAAWNLSLNDAQVETAEIWSGFSRTASANPHAWLRDPLTPDDILRATADNRRLSHPYTKLMVANNNVNQGAAVLITSLDHALSVGIPESALVTVQRGAAARESADFLRRDGFARSPAMEASIAKALEFNRLTPDELDCVELYSCFPCVPKMARRILDWPLDRPHSVYGGLTFGGGPIGNCMMHAIAAMVMRLRGGEKHGLIVANGGYMTYFHSIVLSGGVQSIGAVRQSCDVQNAADILRGGVPPLLDHYEGPALVETFVLPIARAGDPKDATIVARTPSGGRVLAQLPREERGLLDQVTNGSLELVGQTGLIKAAGSELLRWSI